MAFFNYGIFSQLKYLHKFIFNLDGLIIIIKGDSQNVKVTILFFSNL